MSRVFTCLALCVLATTTARAEIALQSPEKLQANSSHIVVGVVKEIRASEKLDDKWARRDGEVVIEVSALEKGEGITAGDRIPARFWTKRWRGPGVPPPYGSGHGLPKKNDTIRAFLKKDGPAYDALLPNGFEVQKSAKEESKEPTKE